MREIASAVSLTFVRMDVDDTGMQNYLVAGKAGSGKDTVGDYLIENYGYQRVSFATPIKRIARELWPDLDWTQKNRVVLQQFGSLCRDIDPDTWVKLAYKTMRELNHNQTPVVITDCRYANELEFFQERGCLALKVEASYLNRLVRLRERDGQVEETALTHISETALDYIRLPVLDNNGDFEELYAQIRALKGL